jgi:hypothetical protein
MDGVWLGNNQNGTILRRLHFFPGWQGKAVLVDIAAIRLEETFEVFSQFFDLVSWV